MLKKRKPPIEDRLGLSIVLLCAALLAIWAMQHTIALRNILLSVGCLFSVIYVYQRKKSAPLSTAWRNLIPLFFIGLLFAWVLIHYFFFSQDEVLQLKELRSIWFRSLEAVILGGACGLAIYNNPTRLRLLAYGLLTAFAVLYFQYIPKVLVSYQLFQPDYINYVFYAKINGVLIGTVLIAGIGGYWIDLTRGDGAVKHAQVIWRTAISLLIIAVPLYSYVFIFGAKNGVGLATILGLFWIFWGLFRFVKGRLQAENWNSKLLSALVILLLFSVIAVFAHLQIKAQPSWQYLVEDIQESVQIDKYPQWKSPSTLGYPSLPSGRVITPNVFERVSWATAGLRLVPKYPWGNGILQYPLERSLKMTYPNVSVNSWPGSTHSGWIEFLLSFGFPALVCLWGALLSIAIRAIKASSPHKGVTMSLVVGIFCLYTVGELSNHHAVEILLFCLGFLAALNFPISRSLKEN